MPLFVVFCIGVPSDKDVAHKRACSSSLSSPLLKKRKDYLSWEDYFMAVAFLSAQRSKDPNSQACTLVRDFEMIWTNTPALQFLHYMLRAEQGWCVGSYVWLGSCLTKIPLLYMQNYMCVVVYATFIVNHSSFARLCYFGGHIALKLLLLLYNMYYRLGPA